MRTRCMHACMRTPTSGALGVSPGGLGAPPHTRALECTPLRRAPPQPPSPPAPQPPSPPAPQPPFPPAPAPHPCVAPEAPGMRRPSVNIRACTGRSTRGGSGAGRSCACFCAGQGQGSMRAVQACGSTVSIFQNPSLVTGLSRPLQKSPWSPQNSVLVDTILRGLCPRTPAHPYIVVLNTCAPPLTILAAPCSPPNPFSFQPCGSTPLNLCARTARGTAGASGQAGQAPHPREGAWPGPLPAHGSASMWASAWIDPASSHMLVSKIKPCMSDVNCLYCENAIGSFNQL